MRKFSRGQLVKSIKTDQVYRVVGTSVLYENHYIVEGVNRGLKYGCDDDFASANGFTDEKLDRTIEGVEHEIANLIQRQLDKEEKSVR